MNFLKKIEGEMVLGLGKYGKFHENEDKLGECKYKINIYII